ncbi:MAG: PilZ domain-containing protein [Myxococcota bacterium]
MGVKRVLELLSQRTWRGGSPPAPRYRPRNAHPVEVQIMGPHLLDVLKARDISTTGIGVFVPHRFEGFNLDTQLELVITLPRQRPFLTLGRIRHATERGGESPFFGVQLTQLSRAQRDTLETYLASGLAKPVTRG